MLAFDTHTTKYFFQTEVMLSEATRHLGNQLLEAKEQYYALASSVWGTKEYPVPIGEQIKIEEPIRVADNKEILVKYQYSIVDIYRGEDADLLLDYFEADLGAIASDEEWAIVHLGMMYLEDYSQVPFRLDAELKVHLANGKILTGKDFYLLQDFEIPVAVEGASGEALFALKVPKDMEMNIVYEFDLEQFYFDGQRLAN